MVKRYFVTHRNGGSRNGNWAVTRANTSRSIKNFKNKRKAVKYGKKVAKRNKPSVLRVQGKNGKFMSEYSYGVKSPAPG